MPPTKVPLSKNKVLIEETDSPTVLLTVKREIASDLKGVRCQRTKGYRFFQAVPRNRVPHYRFCFMALCGGISSPPIQQYLNPLRGSCVHYLHAKLSHCVTCRNFNYVLFPHSIQSLIHTETLSILLM